MVVPFPNQAMQKLREIALSVLRGESSFIQNIGDVLIGCGELYKWWVAGGEAAVDPNSEAAGAEDDLLTQEVVEAQALCEDLGIPLPATAGLGNGALLRFLVEQILVKFLDNPELWKLLIELITKKSTGLV